MSVFDFCSGRFFRAKPDKIAFEIDFNRVEAPALAPDALEIALGQFESRAIREIRKICDTGKLPPMEDFSYVYNLITLFAVRSPAIRTAMVSMQDRIWRQLMRLVTFSEAIYKDRMKHARAEGFIRDGLDVSYESMKDFVRRDAFTISVPPGWHILNEFEIFNEMVHRVGYRYWSVMTVKPGAPDLITCDRPAPTRLNDEKIFFTISPRCALLGALDPIAPAEFELSEARVGLINTQLVMQTIRQIYSRTSQVTFSHGDKLIVCDLRHATTNA